MGRRAEQHSPDYAAGMEAAEAEGDIAAAILLQANTLHLRQGDCLGLWLLNLETLQLQEWCLLTDVSLDPHCWRLK